jgi:hypothetical protein
MQVDSKNTFYDINKLPKNYGILVFPISISRTENKSGQTAEECLEYIKHFSPSKVSEPKIGLNMIYGDFLYLHSDEKASVLKQKFMTTVLKHKNGFTKLISKEWDRFQIQHAFSYEVWNQLYLSYEGDFRSDFNLVKKVYSEDLDFQKYVKEDCEYYGRELTEDQLNFFLEEHLMLYLLSKKQVSLPNEYVQGREQWVLWCYPGVPLKAQAYVYQKNILNLDVPENIYQNKFYDLESRKLVDFIAIDLKTYDYKY